MASRFSVDAVFRAVDKISAPVSKMGQSVRRFNQGLERGLRRTNRAVGNVNAGLMRTGAVAGGALAVGAGIGVRALNKVADAADNLAKTSRRIDFPIEDLQEWGFVASQSGVDTKLFESSLGAFTKRLGEARAGSGALVTLLKKTDTALLDQITSAGSSSEAFEILINKMRETTNASDRAALASAAFSRAGLKLANISDNSADAIARLRKEQRQNGVITMQQAQVLEAYNDSVDSLKRSIFGLTADAVSPLAPELTNLAKATRGWIVENRKLISQRLAEGIQFITDNADSLSQVALGLVKVLGGWLAMVIALKVATLAFNTVMLVAKVVTFAWAVASKVLVATGWLAVGLFKALRFVVLAFNLALAANPIGLVVAAIGLLIAGGIALAANWDSVAATMSGVWESIKSATASGVEFVSGMLDKILAPFKMIKDGIGAIAGAAGSLLGGKASVEVTDGTGAGQNTPQVITAAEQTARSIEERRTTSSAELTIRDETGRAELQQDKNTAAAIRLESSGAF